MHGIGLGPTGWTSGDRGTRCCGGSCTQRYAAGAVRDPGDRADERGSRRYADNCTDLVDLRLQEARSEGEASTAGNWWTHYLVRLTLLPCRCSGRGPRRDFGDVQAVRGIDLTVYSGETWSFLGPNGAGKSTTISFCARCLTPLAVRRESLISMSSRSATTSAGTSVWCSRRRRSMCICRRPRILSSMRSCMACHASW